MSEFKGPIVEGAYYEREDGRIVGPATREDDPSPDYRWAWHIPGGAYSDSYDDAGINYSLSTSDRLTRRVYITHADPAEVVAELRIPTCHHANPYGCGWDEGRYAAADLVAEKLVGEK